MLTMRLILAAFLAMLAGSQSALAGCAYGDQQKPGSIGPHQVDRSRSFTISGSALLTVANAKDDAFTCYHLADNISVPLDLVADGGANKIGAV